MSRINIINHCSECSHFDNLYYMHEETCSLLKRKIDADFSNGDVVYHIPSDCPLEESYSDA